MVDEISGMQSAHRIHTQKQVSLETTAPLQAVSSPAIDSIQVMRQQLEHGLVLMGDIRSQLERAYRELSPSK